MIIRDSEHTLESFNNLLSGSWLTRICGPVDMIIRITDKGSKEASTGRNKIATLYLVRRFNLCRRTDARAVQTDTMPVCLPNGLSQCVSVHINLSRLTSLNEAARALWHAEFAVVLQFRV